jgi:large subunit ribosomal protein L1
VTVVKKSKRYQQSAALVDRAAVYSPEDAVAMAREVASTQFDETVEFHARLNVDPRHAEQQVRGVALLPHGLGRSMRILVFAQGEGARLAEEAGADHVGGDDLAQQIRSGWLEFDVALATQESMRFVGSRGRLRAPRGLMPNARTGTVVTDPVDLPRLIDEAKKGRVEFRVDRTSIIHGPIGKASFEQEKLLENLAAFVDALVRSRPEVVKGQFIRSMSLSTSMGPGIRLDVSAASALRAA